MLRWQVKPRAYTFFMTFPMTFRNTFNLSFRTAVSAKTASVRAAVRALFAAVWLAMLVNPTGATTVAAASDLKFAMDELVGLYHAQTGRKVQAVYGSSGQFVMQIGQGAPFDIFLSADESLVEPLVSKGVTQGSGVLYGVGRLVFFVPKGSPLKLELSDLRPALDDGRLKRFAIANPAHAPYGRAAQQALQKLGVWSAIEPRLVLGENVSQAAQFAASGAAQGGFFALSLALAPVLREAGNFIELPADWHAPLRQRMVLLKRAAPEAQAFYGWLQEPAARAVLRRYGFAMPAR